MSRNAFCGLAFSPSKGAARNIERYCRRYLADYRKDSPGTDWDLTPYQQWVIRLLHQEFIKAHPRTRLAQIQQYILENRPQLSKEHYDSIRRINNS